MSKFRVTVEKTQYLSGVVTVRAKSAGAAQAKVDRLLEQDKLKESDIEWDDKSEDDESGVKTTGDIN